MNYRHAFHAGNFADVLKHLVLIHALKRLATKDKPFTAIDTHAGIGVYDLSSEEARRSPEWRAGIEKLWPPADALRDAPEPVRDALGPYLAGVAAHNPDGALRWYPGSPALMAGAARPGDTVQLSELHPDDARRLADQFTDQPGIKVRAQDGYAGLKGQVPPAARRGLVLIDPPFEHVDEMYFLAQAARDGLERWPTGTFIFWRPLKDLWAAERFDVGLAEWLLGERAFDPEKILRADLWVRELGQDGPLAGAGVVVINPPFGLEGALLAALPWLAKRLAHDAGAGWRLDGALSEDSLTVDEF